MPLISQDSLETQINKNKLSPMYFLFGEEELLIEDSLESLVSVAVEETNKSFNYDVLNSNDNNINDILERVNSYPIMANKRVVVIKDIDKFYPTKSKQDISNSIIKYLKNPLEFTTLIMISNNSDFLGKGKSIARNPFNIIIECSQSVHFKKIYERELPSWISLRVKKRSREIAPEAIEALISYAGTSLRIIDNEIEKLLTFTGLRKKITFEDIEKIVGSSKENNIFELQKAIGERKIVSSSSILANMLRLGESEQLIISMLTRYFSVLWRLTELKIKTRDTLELGRSLGISSFINEYLAACNKFSYSEIKDTFNILQKTDFKLKSTSIDSDAIMQLMLISIIDGKDYMIS
ncbi:MAG: DNA polymerase III subunit delta [Chlorobi bacterium]|nr:DNA polymerase III subunit delta [Chlorobiota bacterium]